MQITPPKIKPSLDPGFLPAALWNRSYRQLAQSVAGSRQIRIAIERDAQARWTFDSILLPDAPEFKSLNLKYVERIVKFLLWAWGGPRVRIAGAPEIIRSLSAVYGESGERHFDSCFIGPRCFGAPLTFEAAAHDAIEPSAPSKDAEPIDLSGNRIGFDLGGSDRKCAALIDGEVVFSEEIKWDPYFEGDPHYHIAGIQDSLERAARHLPSVDAIGGSAAGIYINNEPRVGSLFRGIREADFERHIRGIFKELKHRWGGIPFEVANDGDVTAIAGAMAIQDNAVLGISMGTSQAGGYIDPHGKVTGWLNELAFTPVDYREDAPADEWSGDSGCGVQYFSQQAVARLLPASGIVTDEAMGAPEKLELVQSKIKSGDERAVRIYQSIGTYLGYSIAHYADFYDFRHLLVLGRVSSGPGGEHILKQAREVLDLEFPELSSKIAFQTPDETTKRHGQAVAAASLPRV